MTHCTHLLDEAKLLPLVLVEADCSNVLLLKFLQRKDQQLQ